MKVNDLPLDIDKHKLWADGTITIEPESIISYIVKLSSIENGIERLFVSSINKDVDEYNQFSENQISIKKECNINEPQWNIPIDIDLEEYLYGLVSKIEKDYLYEKRIERLSTEIYLFKKLKLEDVLCVLIYVIDVMTKRRIIWGVGRGSSCSSYLLYLMGLHEVDAVKYEIEIEDFLRE